MNRKEDQFFEMFRDSFADYQPEAPASIYASIRKQLVWSNFLSFSATSFNIWYVALILGASVAAGGYLSTLETEGSLAAQHTALKEFKAPSMQASVVDLTTTTMEESASTTETVISNQVQTQQAAEQNTYVSEVVSAVSHAADCETPVLVNDEELPSPIAETMTEEPIQEMETIQPEVFTPYLLSHTSQIKLGNILQQLQDEDRDVVNVDVIVLESKNDE